MNCETNNMIMAKKKDTPSAFESAFEGLGFTNPEENESIVDMDRLDSTVDVDERIIDEQPNPNEKDVEDVKTEDAHVDDTEIPEEVLKQMNNQKNENDNNTETVDEIDTEDVTEAQQIGALFDAVVESFGWNASDIDEDKRPVTVEGLTDYLRAVVDENSRPEYADDRIAQLDQYVKNGGKFEDFYQQQSAQINYDNINLEDETNQKAVVRELLKYSNYTDEQISRKIERYEDADMLEEEAEDALARLKDIKKAEVEQLKARQEEALRQQQEQSMQFFNDVSTQINNLTDIRGISIPKEDRKALFEYIFKQDAQGLSQYQKDFNENIAKNLIESAYFTMKADAFVTEAKKSGETSAADKLRKMLRHTSKNHSSFNADEDKTRPAWEIASRYL